ncbi:MAG TPA: hypothetical protein VK249_00155 [Anaerolineales bacterium]|nr:hypothetical protein [Anaerolineales bacterium]
MANSFALVIDPLSSGNGWMHCWLVVDGRSHYLDATSVFPPFGDVLRFARAIAQNQLPHEFFWDEEGHGVKFQARPLSPRSGRFRLQVTHDGEVVVDAEFDRMQIAGGLLESLRHVALDCPGAESEWQFPYFLIEDFERDLAQGFHKPVRPGLVSTPHFVFNHYSGYGGTQTPAFTIWVDDHPALFMAMDDHAELWQAWFGLLEKIKSGDLPVAVVFKREGEAAAGLFSMFGMEVVFHFQAEPTPKPGQFRLKIIGQHPKIKPAIDQLMLEVILDPQQFVRAFAHSFKQFLETDYLAFLNSAENRFDLRSLPLDRLVS